MQRQILRAVLEAVFAKQTLNALGRRESPPAIQRLSGRADACLTS
jgi:hypothetical protein